MHLLQASSKTGSPTPYACSRSKFHEFKDLFPNKDLITLWEGLKLVTERPEWAVVAKLGHLGAGRAQLCKLEDY